jgi:hypothetical protein
MKSAAIFTICAFLLALAASVSAQENQYPNEIKGYEFFGSGKLKNLKLTVSSKNDVKKAFGEKCEKQCDYDADWRVVFKYYEDIWIRESRNEKEEKLTYFLDSRYLGKLRSIEVRPKNRISFISVEFSEAFQQLIRTSTTDTRSGKSSMTVNDAFQDSHGLSYELYSRTNYDDIKQEQKNNFT